MMARELLSASRVMGKGGNNPVIEVVLPQVTDVQSERGVH